MELKDYWILFEINTLPYGVYSLEDYLTFKIQLNCNICAQILPRTKDEHSNPHHLPFIHSNSLNCSLCLYCIIKRRDY